MKTDFLSPFGWQDLNERVDTTLDLKSRGASARVYLGLNHGLAEVTLGLLRQFPHRKKVYYVKDLDPYYEAHMMAMAREGAIVKSIDRAVLTKPEEFVSELDAEALFLLYSEDDPLLGILHDVSPLENALKDKKVFRLRVSHAHHYFLPQPPAIDKFEVRLWSMGPGLALATVGERTRWTSLTADGAWFNESAFAQIEKLKRPQFLNPIAVEKFEAWAETAGAFVVLKNQPRLADRAVISFTDLDGWSLANHIATQMQMPLAAAGTPGLLEAASRHRWGGLKTMDWLRSYGLDDRQIRGLLLVDQSLLKKEFPAVVEAARTEVLRMQNG